MTTPLQAFPRPPDSLCALGALRKDLETALSQGADWDAIAQLIAPYKDPHDVPQPWDGTTLDQATATDWWQWLDLVVTWINHQHCWHTQTYIPSCWPEHPHIVHDLAVVAWVRYETTMESSPQRLSEWHKYDLPMFFQRLNHHLQATSCLTTTHTPNPLRHKMENYSPSLPLSAAF